MADPVSKARANLLDENYGSSITSGSSHIRWDSRNNSPARLAVPSNDEDHDHEHELRRRRSSISMRIDSLMHVGGVNSFDNFARSWQRAAGFVEMRSSRPEFVMSNDEDVDQHDYRRRDEESTPQERTSLLREQLQKQSGSDNTSKDDGDSQEPSKVQDDAERRPSAREAEPNDSIAGVFSPSLYATSPFGPGFGTSYGSLTSRVNESSMRHANELWREQQVTGAQKPDKEREPLYVRQVEQEDGTVVNVVVGRSTLPQTVFNSVNVLIGIGLLSLPLGIKYAGWIVGLSFLTLAAIVTAYTAKILAKCLDVDGTLITFADIAYVAFGPKARIITSLLFIVELLAACVALIILFADSLDDLIPGYGRTSWSIFCGLVLIPTNFLPLRVLSFTSILGIVCTFSILIIVLLDGLMKPHTPGSLREPAQTYLFPENWLTLPLSFGLLMSPWGGHSVCPSLYRDMRHPYKYGRAITTTWSFTYFLDLSMAVLGLLMFGDGIRDEITSNILLTKGYPRVLSILMVVAIAVIPITKLPLNARPIISTIEILCGIDIRAISTSSSLVGMSGYGRGVLKITIRVVGVIVFVLVALVIPSFDRIMAFMGSALCFTICIVLPLTFHLKIYGKEIPLWQRCMDLFLIIVSSILAVIGTVWAFLPKDRIGA